MILRQIPAKVLILSMHEEGKYLTEAVKAEGWLLLLLEGDPLQASL